METIENPVIGEKITFITTSKQSGGEKTLMQIHLGIKGGNPLHYHKRFSETFNVKEGEASIFKPDSSGKAELIARVQAVDWLKAVNKN